MFRLLQLLRSRLGRREASENADAGLRRRISDLSNEDLRRLRRQLGPRVLDRSDPAAQEGALDEYDLAGKELNRRVAAMSDAEIEEHLVRLTNARRNPTDDGEWNEFQLRDELAKRERRREEARREEAEKRNREQMKKELARKSDADLESERVYYEKVLANRPNDSHPLQNLTDVTGEIASRRTRVARQFALYKRTSLAIAAIGALIALVTWLWK
jgi:hypothetical protein